MNHHSSQPNWVLETGCGERREGSLVSWIQGSITFSYLVYICTKKASTMMYFIEHAFKVQN